MDYALEVFIDFQSGSYYFNKRYQQDMQIFDIDVHEHWAILIGYDAHRVVYHSVYNKFIQDQDREAEVYFLDYDLIKVETYDRTVGDEDSRHVLFGLSNDDVRLFHVVTTLPKIICRSHKPQEQRYYLQFNSTQCVSKKADNDNSQFSQCQVDHTFDFVSLGVIVDEDKKPIIYAVVSVVGYNSLNMIAFCGYLACLLFCTWCTKSVRREISLWRSLSSSKMREEPTEWQLIQSNDDKSNKNNNYIYIWVCVTAGNPLNLRHTT